MTQRWQSALVTELRKCGEKLPASLRDRIIAEGENLVPALVDVLIDEDESDDGWGSIHAVELLADLKASVAIAPMLRVLGETEWDHIIHDRIGLAQHRGDAAAAAIPRVVNETTAPLARAALLPAYAERGRARASAPRMSKSGYGLPSRELEVLQLEQAVARRWCFGHP
jgi:hypothetical protein